MKTLLNVLMVLLITMPLSVLGVEIFPHCYRGEITWDTKDGSTSKSPVFLEFSKIGKGTDGKSLAFVKTFTIGGYSMPVSGKMLEDNSLVFNTNDDYIPGGNATFNRDVFLNFSDGKKPWGHFHDYRYSSGAYGGYQSRSEGIVEASGRIDLKLCKSVIIDL